VGTKQGIGSSTFLEDLSREFSALSAMLAGYAERDTERRDAAARERVTLAQVQAVLAASYARCATFGLDLADPGWSLLLELFRAYLEKRSVRMARLATDARVAATTATRWLALFEEGGFLRREADPERAGGSVLTLTEPAIDAIEDYFVALQLAWAEPLPPKRRLQSSI
jgi:DNA-binding MarR family transcriptional regulator